MTDRSVTKQQCIHRAGCPKPSVCQQVGHCTSMSVSDLLHADMSREEVDRLMERSRAKAEAVQPLKADDASTSAPFPSNLRVWIAMKGNKESLRLAESDGWEVHEVAKAPACSPNSPEDIHQSMSLLQQIHRESENSNPKRICLGCGEPSPCASDCPAGSAVETTVSDEAPRPWRLWKTGERSELPHIADANGRVVARAEGNIWVWQDFIAPVIVSAVNRAPRYCAHGSLVQDLPGQENATMCDQCNDAKPRLRTGVAALVDETYVPPFPQETSTPYVMSASESASFDKARARSSRRIDQPENGRTDGG